MNTRSLDYSSLDGNLCFLQGGSRDVVIGAPQRHSLYCTICSSMLPSSHCVVIIIRLYISVELCFGQQTASDRMWERSAIHCTPAMARPHDKACWAWHPIP